jgi:acyl-CoA hydrolase
MVAIDNQMRPIPIPQFTPKSDDEKKLWKAAESARDAMKASD